MTAAGQPVPASKAKARGPKGNLAPTLKEIVDLYAHLPQSQRKPAQAITDDNRPTVAPPDGGVVLTTYDRFLRRDDEGQYHAIAGHRTTAEKLSVPGPQRNSLWLTKDECHAFMPDRPHKGQTLAVPASVARRIAQFGFIPASAWHGGYEWKPDSVKASELTLNVEEVSDSRVRLRIHGSVLLVTKTIAGYGVDRPNLPDDLNNQFDARLEGQIEYDPAHKKITRWDMIALGDYTGICYGYDHPRPFAIKPLALGFAFELDRGSYELPAGLRRNKPAVLTYVAERFYFDPEKWEADWKKRNKK